MTTSIKYTIAFEESTNLWELYSVVGASFGGDAANYISSSSDKEQMEELRDRLIKMGWD